MDRLGWLGHVVCTAALAMALGCGTEPSDSAAAEEASGSAEDAPTSSGDAPTSSGDAPVDEPCAPPEECFGNPCAANETDQQYLGAFRSAIDELGMSDRVFVRFVFPDELYGYAVEYTLLVDWVEVAVGAYGDSPEAMRANALETFPSELLDRTLATRSAVEDALRACNPEVDIDLCVKEPWAIQIEPDPWRLQAQAQRPVGFECETEFTSATIDLATAQTIACSVQVGGECEETE